MHAFESLVYTDIVKYGYLIIFLLIFTQELGIPDPVPNELALLFAGYLVSAGKLQIIPLALAAVAADFIGTSGLFFIFRRFGKYLMKKKIPWLNTTRMEEIRVHVENGGIWGIYVGRLLPYIRAYTSAAAGVLEIESKVFLPAVFMSAITWSGIYLTLGYVVGNRWQALVSKLGWINLGILGVVLIVLSSIFGPRLYARIFKQQKK